MFKEGGVSYALEVPELPMDLRAFGYIMYIKGKYKYLAELLLARNS
mgnify:CR=1 FL=1